MQRPESNILLKGFITDEEFETISVPGYRFESATNIALQWLKNRAFTIKGIPRRSSPFLTSQLPILANFKQFEFADYMTHERGIIPVYRIVARDGQNFCYYFYNRHLSLK